MQPLAFEIPYTDPFDIVQRLPADEQLIFFDSAMQHDALARYSYIVYQPFETMVCQQQSLKTLQQQWQQYKLTTIENLPPFQGGVAGMLSYDLLTEIENVSLPEASSLPKIAVGFYDVVIAFDHQQQRAWIISSGLPETQVDKRLQHARRRYQQVLVDIQKPTLALHSDFALSEITSNFNQQQYCAMVQRVKDYILAGDIFEACVAQRFNCHVSGSLDALLVYQQLRSKNPATFSAYLNFKDFCLLSASPERFLQVHNRVVETRPIKGTSKRNSNPIVDQELAEQLMQSEKDRAENAMIVDLLRNDLSKVCLDESVNVKAFAELESYATVHHLVSTIQAELKPEADVIDLIRATFPGGSITGAPKIRAMEIISELEPCNRGPYCGNLVWLGFNGDMDSSILIRTMVLQEQQLTFHAGGAVVLDSDPEQEYQETLAKAVALRETLMQFVGQVA